MLGINQIYQMDCFVFISKISDKSIDLAVLDPPYNMKKANWDSFPTETQFFEFTFSWIDALLPKLKDNGSLYIFNTPYNSAFILQHLVSKKMKFKNWITWDKRDGQGSSTRRFRHEQETVLFFTKSDKHTFNLDDVRIPYQSKDRIEAAKKVGLIKNGKRWFPNENGRQCGEVWHIVSERHKNKLNGKTVKLNHITPKPLEMIERIIKASSNEGDLVLDCFAGSGTTAVAAHKLNRNYICADFLKEHVEESRRRIKCLTNYTA
jgi:site-specific DNA-methyltransferase (adenine-specific)